MEDRFRSGIDDIVVEREPLASAEALLLFADFSSLLRRLSVIHLQSWQAKVVTKTTSF